MKLYTIFFNLIAVTSISLLTACSSPSTPKDNTDSDETPVLSIDSVKSYVLNAKNVLGSNLVRAIGEKGSAGAVEFCHSRASEITDSISAANQLKIYRRSDKQRNPANKASVLQMKLIKNWKKQLMAKQTPKPVTDETDSKVYYFPIVTEPLCMQCHGEKKNLAPDVLNTLQRYYPQDQATGYKTGELRGMWVVELD